MAHDLQLGVDRSELFLRAGDFGSADVLGKVNDLALKVGDVDDVEVDEPKRANACRCEIQRQRRPQTPGADAEHLGGLEPLLALHGHLGHDQMPGISLNFRGRQARPTGAIAQQVGNVHIEILQVGDS